jgi:L-alanine-DL-glutamate epimerase-like enolase superfamily enzyme
MSAIWSRATTKLLKLNLERPVGGSGVKNVDVIIVEIEDSDGAVGLGFSYVLGGAGGELSALAADQLLRTFIVGQAVTPPRALWKKIFESFNRSGLGPNIIGLAAIDTTCWDLEAKRRGVPLGVAMGGVPRSVPVYASGNYSTTQSASKAAETTAAHISRGFRWVKPRVSGGHNDLGLISAVREAAGDQIGIMIDANEKCDVLAATRLFRLAEEFRVVFVEEPLPAKALTGLNALKRSSNVPLALGEHIQEFSLLVSLMVGGIVDVIQPDLAMIGGLTPAYDLAIIAEGLDIAMSPHFLPGLFVHVASVSNSLRWLEEFPLLEPLFNGWPEMSADGEVCPTNSVGHGLTLSEMPHSLLLKQS